MHRDGCSADNILFILHMHILGVHMGMAFLGRNFDLLHMGIYGHGHYFGMGVIMGEYGTV